MRIEQEQVSYETSACSAGGLTSPDLVGLSCFLVRKYLRGTREEPCSGRAAQRLHSRFGGSEHHALEPLLKTLILLGDAQGGNVGHLVSGGGFFLASCLLAFLPCLLASLLSCLLPGSLSSFLPCLFACLLSCFLPCL